MYKKYYVSIIFIFLIMIPIITNANRAKTNSNTNNNIPPVVDDNPTPVEDNTGEMPTEDDDDIFDGGVIDLLDTYLEKDGVKIFTIKQMDDEYVAIGAKDNQPYIETLKVVDNKLTPIDSGYIYNQGTGTFIDMAKVRFHLLTTIEDNNTQYQKTLIETSNGLLPFYKEQLTFNYYVGKVITPKYIVIHETANTNVGADADAHYRYWSTQESANASTHFVVDDKQIYQMLDLNQAAWHVGDNKGYSDITNLNSIGIEIAVNKDGDFTKARQNAIDLVIKLLKYLDLDITALKRHNDASGKYCPSNMLGTPQLWIDFIEQVKLGINN